MTRTLRIVLSVIAVVWLSLSSQPCVMAMEAGVGQDSAVTPGYLVPGSFGASACCDDCAPSMVCAREHCIGQSPVCAADGRVSVDSHGLLSGSGPDVVAPPADRLRDWVGHRVLHLHSFLHRAVRSGEPSLNIRYCVFLN